jgi:hypothetical protein
MSAQDLRSLLKTVGVNAETQLEAQQTRAEMVAKYRRYAEGDHDARLTTEMRHLLSVKSNPDGSHPYNINYMELIVDTLVDRLNITGIDSDNDTATEWASKVLEDQRIDALQLGVHEAAIRDADTYVLADYDNEENKVRWTHEPAFDGTNGVLVFYETSASKYPFLAIKVWCVKGYDDKLIERVRCNLYFKDRIERQYKDTYVENGINAAGDWLPFTEDGIPATQKWLAGRVPIVHYKNKSTRYNNHGTSELKNIIPLQDTLNATNVSMVSTSQLTGFPIRWGIGFEMPAALTPGMWIQIGASPVASDQRVELGTLEQGEILPFVQQAQFTIMQIATISRTPIPELVNADSAASGEALKQRESGLLGKIRRCHVSFGNSWEDLLDLTAKIQEAYGGDKPPPYKSLSARWESGEVRNDTEVIDNALKVWDKVGDKEGLRLIAPVFDYDEAKIEQILEEKAEQTEQEMQQMTDMMGGSAPAFGNPANGKPRPAFAGANPMINKNGAK